MYYLFRNLGVLLFFLIVTCKFDSAISTLSNLDGQRDNKTNNDGPLETQKAVCVVTAGEVRASAEAVVTKDLSGVCGTEEMNLALRNLELRIHKELQDIKLLLKEYQKSNRQIENAHLISTDNESLIDTVDDRFPKQTTTSATESTPVNHKKSIPLVNNQSIQKSFSYYWKLENFIQYVNSSYRKIESPIFSIKDKPLRIKGSFNHHRQDFLYLHLVYATFEQSDKVNSNIVLDTGGIFKNIDDKLPFKHKISILDQNFSLKDLESQEFSTLDSGFSVPISALLLPTYSKNNSLLIQISLYL